MEKQQNALAPYSRWLWSNTSAAGSGRTPEGRQDKAGPIREGPCWPIGRNGGGQACSTGKAADMQQGACGRASSGFRQQDRGHAARGAERLQAAEGRRHKKNADDRIRGRAIIPVFLSKNWKLLELNFFFTFT